MYDFVANPKCKEIRLPYLPMWIIFHYTRIIGIRYIHWHGHLKVIVSFFGGLPMQNIGKFCNNRCINFTPNL